MLNFNIHFPFGLKKLISLHNMQINTPRRQEFKGKIYVTKSRIRIRTNHSGSTTLLLTVRTWEKSVPRGADAPFRTSVSGSEGCPLFPAQMPSGNSQPASLKKKELNITEGRVVWWRSYRYGPVTKWRILYKLHCTTTTVHVGTVLWYRWSLTPI